MKKYYFILNRKQTVFDYIKKGLLSIVVVILIFALAIFICAFLQQPNRMVQGLLVLPFFVIFFVNYTARRILAEKGVKLQEDFLEFETYMFKYRIRYEKICNVEKAESESIGKSKAKKLVVRFGANENYVKLLSKSGKECYLPVADTESFINDVLMHCNTEINNTAL